MLPITGSETVQQEQQRHQHHQQQQDIDTKHETDREISLLPPQVCIMGWYPFSLPIKSAATNIGRQLTKLTHLLLSASFVYLLCWVASCLVKDIFLADITLDPVALSLFCCCWMW